MWCTLTTEGIKRTYLDTSHLILAKVNLVNRIYSRLPCYVFCICMLTDMSTNEYQKYKSIELGDQLQNM